VTADVANVSLTVNQRTNGHAGIRSLAIEQTVASNARQSNSKAGRPREPRAATASTRWHCPHNDRLTPRRPSSGTLDGAHTPHTSDEPRTHPTALRFQRKRRRGNDAAREALRWPCTLDARYAASLASSNDAARLPRRLTNQQAVAPQWDVAPGAMLLVDASSWTLSGRHCTRLRAAGRAVQGRCWI